MRLRIVVSSPGDVKLERKHIADIVEELNDIFTPFSDLYFDLSLWEKVAFPGFHDSGPQGIIDPILRIKDCNIFIGLFGMRFGTPTFDAPSGTKHEFDQAYENWKQKKSPHIMIYFKKPDHIPDTSEDLEQWSQVLKFKKEFPKEGLFWIFETEEEFVKLIRRHLIQYILSMIYSSSPIIPFGTTQIQEEKAANQNNGASPSPSSLVFRTIGRLPDMNEFFGPKHEYDSLIERVRNGESVSIVNENRVGKSWLIDYFCLKAQKELGRNYLICRLYPIQCKSEAELVKALLSELNRLGIDTQSYDRPTFGVHTIEEVVKYLSRKGQTLILCIDEFEDFVYSEGFSQKFFIGLRAIATAHGHFVLVVASKSSLKDVIRSLPSVPNANTLSKFPNFLPLMELRPFQKTDAENFVEAKGTQAGFTPQEKDYLLLHSEEKGAYPPLRLQLLGLLIQEEQRKLGMHLSADKDLWKDLVERLERIYEAAAY